MSYLVDSSVWIDFLNGRVTPETDFLARRMNPGEVLIGDLILAEVLQGIANEREFNRVQRLMLQLSRVTIGGTETAIAAARNFRTLREHGITVRKTIDTLIATRCIIDGLPLLYSDRDFEPFREHLGLVSALTLT